MESLARKEREITYLVTDADGATAEEWRFTVGPLSMMDAARYQVYLREGFAWAEGVELPEEDPMRLLRVQMAVARARMLAATKRTAHNGAAAELPEEWRSVEGFVLGVPQALSRAWLEAATACNAGLFGVEAGDDAKNAGGVSVRL